MKEAKWQIFSRQIFSLATAGLEQASDLASAKALAELNQRAALAYEYMQLDSREITWTRSRSWIDVQGVNLATLFDVTSDFLRLAERSHGLNDVFELIVDITLMHDELIARHESPLIGKR